MSQDQAAFRQRHQNLRVRGLGPSATLAINEKSAKLIREGRRIYKLGLGQSPFPVPRPVVEALKESAHEKDYLPVAGLWPLREQVARFHERKEGLSVSASDVLIGPGSKELMFLLQLVYYGHLVIPSPSWVSYAPQAQILGRSVHWLKTARQNKWRLTPRELDEFCSKDPDCPRLVILNYPDNPTGCTYREEELRELAAVARKYSILLLSDEIYGELHYQGKHMSVARFYPEGTIISSGLSKWCGAGGWRLGTFVFPKPLRWLLEGMAAVASETFTSTCAPIQYAAITAFTGGPELERYLTHSRRILQALGDAVYERLSGLKLQLHQPEGGFYVFADFETVRHKLVKKDIYSAADLSSRLLEETGVALLPGNVFGRPKEELTARLAFVDFDGARAIAASEALPMNASLDSSFLKEYCGNVMAAIDHLGHWLGSPNQ